MSAAPSPPFSSLADPRAPSLRDCGVKSQYRPLLRRAHDLSVRFARCGDPPTPLVHTTGAALAGLPPPPPEGSGPRRAAVLEFALDSSTYATEFLRELLCSDCVVEGAASGGDE